MSNRQEPSMVFKDEFFQLTMGDAEYVFAPLEAFMFVVELNILVNDEPAVYREQRATGVEPIYSSVYVPDGFSRDDAKLLLRIVKTAVWSWEGFDQLAQEVKAANKKVTS